MQNAEFFNAINCFVKRPCMNERILRKIFQLRQAAKKLNLRNRSWGKAVKQ